MKKFVSGDGINLATSIQNEKLNNINFLYLKMDMTFYDISEKKNNFDWQSIIQKDAFNKSFGLMLYTGNPDNIDKRKQLKFYINSIESLIYYWDDLKENNKYEVICKFRKKKAIICIDKKKVAEKIMYNGIENNKEPIVIGMNDLVLMNYPLVGKIENMTLWGGKE